MRVAVIADSHFDESSRWDECVRVHAWIAEDLRERGVDLVLHAGDVFERKSTPTERRAVADWLRSVADIAPVVVVRGNHDALGDLPLFARLRTRHAITVVEDARVVHVAGAAVACLAWPQKARILAQAQLTHAEGELVAGDALRSVLRGLGQQLATHEGPRILLAHAMVHGSRTSTGQPLVGCDLEVGLDDLQVVGADAYALGHIHKGQAWELTRATDRLTHSPLPAPVIYPGSPRRTAFGEVETKGYTLLSFRTSGAFVAQEQLVETPCAPMVLVQGEFDDLTLDGTRGTYRLHHDGAQFYTPGTEIRLRYLVDADRRDAARRAADDLAERWRAAGAALVKIEEEVVPTTRARAPEIATAPNLAAKLRAYWRARDTTPDDARSARLVSLATSLEEAA